LSLLRLACRLLHPGHSSGGGHFGQYSRESAAQREQRPADQRLPQRTGDAAARGRRLLRPRWHGDVPVVGTDSV